MVLPTIIPIVQLPTNPIDYPFKELDPSHEGYIMCSEVPSCSTAAWRSSEPPAWPELVVEG